MAMLTTAGLVASTSGARLGKGCPSSSSGSEACAALSWAYDGVGAPPPGRTPAPARTTASADSPISNLRLIFLFRVSIDCIGEVSQLMRICRKQSRRVGGPPIGKRRFHCNPERLLQLPFAGVKNSLKSALQ
ncbi:MAG: hypothetical protein F4013_12165 [Gammaproteobacteria bacterium]|nr:hypothetical protein [Gammaproteobacteria bacterium]